MMSWRKTERIFPFHDFNSIVESADVTFCIDFEDQSNYVTSQKNKYLLSFIYQDKAMELQLWDKWN